MKWAGVGLLLLPLIQWWPYYSPYEIPKVWFVMIGVEIFLAVSLLQIGKWRYQVTKWLLVPILLLATLFVSSLINHNLDTSWWGNPRRMDGLFTLLHLVAISLGIAVVWQKNWGETVMKYSALGSITVSLWNILGTLIPAIVPDSARWSEGVAIGFGNPNLLAGYLVVTLPAVGYMIHLTKSPIKWWWMGGMTMQILTILLTRSWGGILGILAYTALVCVKKWRTNTVILMLVALLLVVGMYWRDYSSKLEPLQVVAESRERIIMKGIIALSQKPVLGWGWAQYAMAFNQVDWPFHYSIEAYVDRAHSSLLEMAVAGGIVGLILYIAIVVKALQVLLTQKDLFYRSMGMVLILYLIHSQTNVTSVAEELWMWITVGISLKVTANS